MPLEQLNTTQPFALHTDNISTAIDIDGTVHPVTRSSNMIAVGTNSRLGFQNPWWKSQCKNGSNATTPFVGVEYDAGDAFVSAYSIGTQFNPLQGNREIGRWDYTSSGFIQPNIIASTISVPSNVITDVTNRCIKKFLAECTAAMSSENLTGRSIKHFKHDIHSTLHPMTGIRDKISSYLTSLEKVKYGKLRGPSLLSAISSSYLEFKFGVQPFVTDITDILTDLVIKDRKRNPTVPVEATASSTYQGSDQISSWINSGYFSAFQPKHYAVVTASFSVRMKGGIRTNTGMDGRVGFIQDNRLLPEDWAPTIASILPYAWMVSYFTNVRDIIDGISFRTSNLSWGSKNTRAMQIVRYGQVFASNPNPFANPPNVNVFSTVISGGSSTSSYKSTQRSSITGPDLVPTIEFTIPSSPTPWLNMMAAFLPRILKVVF